MGGRVVSINVGRAARNGSVGTDDGVCVCGGGAPITGTGAGTVYCLAADLS